MSKMDATVVLAARSGFEGFAPKKRQNTRIE